MAALLVAPIAAMAQDPVRLPGVVVKAKPNPPGPKLFAGTVKDTLANPLEGVEVTIPRLQKRVFTKDDGTFRFDDVKPGKYSMRARKVGYAPQVRDFEVEEEGGTGEFELMPVARALPAVVTSAARGGLSGVVADTGYNTVAGAMVSVLGKSMSTLTDSSGGFFLPAPPGSYMVSIRKDGFAEKVASVRIPADSGRHMRAMLGPWRPIPVKEAWNIADLASRQAWRNKQTMPFYTREEIQKLGVVWIYDLVRMAGSDQYSNDCQVVVNGGPTYMDLATLTVDDVESVEVYQTARVGRPRSMQTGMPRITPARPSRGETLVPLSNTSEAAFQNLTRNCPTVYVWLR
ncbi:MAG: carboxypeptidase-like regulatory domain-containing protein [Gemmatimonadaceae bacterium]